LFGLHELFVGLINGVDALKFIEYAVHDIRETHYSAANRVFLAIFPVRFCLRRTCV
jgi:hypothetical protein